MAALTARSISAENARSATVSASLSGRTTRRIGLPSGQVVTLPAVICASWCRLRPAKLVLRTGGENKRRAGVGPRRRALAAFFSAQGPRADADIHRAGEHRPDRAGAAQTGGDDQLRVGPGLAEFLRQQLHRAQAGAGAADLDRIRVRADGTMANAAPIPARQTAWNCSRRLHVRRVG